MDQDLQIASAHAQHSVPDPTPNEPATAMQVDSDNVKEVNGFIELVGSEEKLTCISYLSQTTAPASVPNTENDALDQAIAGEKTTQDYDSSDLDSSDDDDDDSSDDSDEDDQQQQHTAVYSDEEDNGNMPLKTHNEISDFVVEKPEFVIDENTTVKRVGTIIEIIDKAIIVQSDPTMNMALDMGTLFAYEDRQVMGEVSVMIGSLSF